MELKDQTTKEESIQMIEAAAPAERPLPPALRYLMVGFLVVGVVGVVAFGFISQTSVRAPAASTSAASCKDPVTENRLRETLKQSPNDFATLMDWGSYNLTCEKNYAVAAAAYRQAENLSNQVNSTIQPTDRAEAQFRLGLSYLYNQNFKEAQGQFELILAERPQDTSAMFALGALFARTDPAKAAPHLQKVIELEGSSPLAEQAKSLLDSLNAPARGTSAALTPPPTPSR